METSPDAIEVMRLVVDAEPAEASAAFDAPESRPSVELYRTGRVLLSFLPVTWMRRNRPGR